MTFSMEVPDAYGFVILSCTVLPAIANIYMGGPVMKARKTLDVPYPNLYATPGYHKKADEFNRVQRGHQNFFENVTSFTAMSLVGGLKHPVAVAVSGVLFCVGSALYQKGYADMSCEVGSARYKKGAAIKWFGIFCPMYCCVSLAGNMAGWW